MYQNLSGKTTDFLSQFTEDKFYLNFLKPIELVTPEMAQMTDSLKAFLNVMDFDRFLLDLNLL